MREKRISIDGMALKRAIRSRGYTCKLISVGISKSEVYISQIIRAGCAPVSTIDLLNDRFHILPEEYVSRAEDVKRFAQNDESTGEAAKQEENIILRRQVLVSALREAVAQGVLDAVADVFGRMGAFFAELGGGKE